MVNKIPTDWGYVIELGSTDEVGVSIIVLKSGEKLPKHYHEIMKEYEIILEGEATVNGKLMKKDSFSIWKKGEPHEYMNNGDQDVKILCVTMPPYIPEDEIRV